MPWSRLPTPDATGDESSLSCFNEPFHEVEKVVQGMDEQIERAEDALDLAKHLRRTADNRRGGLSVSAGQGAAGRRPATRA